MAGRKNATGRGGPWRGVLSRASGGRVDATIRSADPRSASPSPHPAGAQVDKPRGSPRACSASRDHRGCRRSAERASPLLSWRRSPGPTALGARRRRQNLSWPPARPMLRLQRWISSRNSLLTRMPLHAGGLERGTSVAVPPLSEKQCRRLVRQPPSRENSGPHAGFSLSVRAIDGSFRCFCDAYVIAQPMQSRLTSDQAGLCPANPPARMVEFAILGYRTSGVDRHEDAVIDPPAA